MALVSLVNGWRLTNFHQRIDFHFHLFSTNTRQILFKIFPIKKYERDVQIFCIMLRYTRCFTIFSEFLAKLRQFHVKNLSLQIIFTCRRRRRRWYSGRVYFLMIRVTFVFTCLTHKLFSVLFVLFCFSSVVLYRIGKQNWTESLKSFV